MQTENAQHPATKRRMCGGMIYIYNSYILNSAFDLMGNSKSEVNCPSA
jgi:hypothetical protein